MELENVFSRPGNGLENDEIFLKFLKSHGSILIIIEVEPEKGEQWRYFYFLNQLLYRSGKPSQSQEMEIWFCG